MITTAVDNSSSNTNNSSNSNYNNTNSKSNDSNDNRISNNSSNDNNSSGRTNNSNMKLVVGQLEEMSLPTPEDPSLNPDISIFKGHLF